MSTELLINKYHDLAVVADTANFIARFLNEMQAQAVPANIQLAVCEYVMQFPGRAWNGCAIDNSSVTLIISLSETDDEHYDRVITIHYGDDGVSVNGETLAEPVQSMLDALNAVKYTPVVEDIELTTATALHVWDQFRIELLDEFTPAQKETQFCQLTEVWVQAESLVNLAGEALIDLEIGTNAMGEWPGGKAKVIAINPDPACPEIVMQVCNDWGEIGVFANESIQVDADWLKSVTKE